MLTDVPATVEVAIEVSRGGLVKRSGTGVIEFVSPVPCPFNYGSVTGWDGADGDALDAVVLGPRLPVGHVGRFCVLGVVAFIDAGLPDPKLVCGDRITATDRRRLVAFFRTYAAIKRLAAFAGRKGGARFEGLTGLPGQDQG